MQATYQSTASRRAVLAGLAAAPVATLPGLAAASACPAPDPKLVALFEEYVEFVRVINASNVDIADDDPQWNKQEELFFAIIHFPSTSAADVLIKFRIYAHDQCERIDDELVELWDRRDEGYEDERILLAIARDIHRLAGAPAV